MRVTDPRGVERKLRASARLDLALRRCQGDPRRPWAQDAATRVGQELEKCEPDYVGVVDEERNDFGNLVEVAIEDRGVEHDRKVEPAHALDVFLAQGVQRHLAGIPSALLRQINVKGNVDESRTDQLLQQVAFGADAIGEQGGPHACFANPSHNRDELVTPAQRRIASGDLHVGMRSVVIEDHVDAPEHLLDGKILDRSECSER